MNNLTNHAAETVATNDVALVEIETTSPLFFDPYTINRQMGSFILIDPLSNATVAAGIIEFDCVNSGHLLVDQERRKSKDQNSADELVDRAKAFAGLERQPTIAVDFDGVIAEYDGWKGEHWLGNPRTDVVNVLRILQSEGWKVVIHTTRSELHIAEYLQHHEIPYDEINRNSAYSNLGAKPVATVYWDDRALRYSGDALKDLDSIRNFRTWNGRV